MAHTTSILVCCDRCGLTIRAVVAIDAADRHFRALETAGWHIGPDSHVCPVCADVDSTAEAGPIAA